MNMFNKNKKSNKFILKVATISVCVLMTIVNVNPIFANSSSDTLAKSNVIKVVDAKNYALKQGNYEVKIRVPKIEGLNDKDLESKLNSEFAKDGKKLYNEFQEEMKKANNKGHKYLDVSYSVKNNSKDFLSIEIKKDEIEASSYVSKKHYTIDKNREIVLNLPIFFKDSRYIKIISDNIKEQMRNQIKKDNTKSYFIDQEKDSPVKDFKSIDKYQDFYFNKDGHLVICFDEYNVAPGYMGSVEFVIPDKIIKSLK